MIIRPITPPELPILTELFDYNDSAEMIKQNEQDMNNGTIDIFVMFDNDRPIGELHVAYESDDERAVKGKKAYLFAFRIHEDYQGRGYGKQLLQSVIDTLAEQGYAYTWWSYRAAARPRNIGWRIDYFIVSDRFMERVKDSVIFAEVMGSDHCPVGLIVE